MAGYTPTQEKQLDFLRRCESREALGPTYTYWIDCKDCKESKEFRAACSCIDFIHGHKGHRTWVQHGGVGRGYRP